MGKKDKEQKSIEQTIWAAADKMRGAVEPAEYKHVVLSLIFLKYANDKFDEHRRKMIEAGQSQFLEMMPFYVKDNVFFIPECARWSYIMQNAKQDDIAIKIDTALHELETKNSSLSGALPDNYYSRLHLDSGCLSSLLDLINGIDLQKEADKDVFGRVYEYCLKEFALKEGKGKGEFYTPKSVVALLCELIQPYSGIVYDGACGSGGMFVQSMKFVEEHKGNKKNISIYGQEYTDTTRRLCKMNLAIRGISANLGDEAANTFLNDKHKDLKADFALENPPFNQKDWRTADQLTDDPRWLNKYTTPPTSNANYGWLLNTLSKLSVNGVGAVLLANGALSADGTEYEIRKQMIDNDKVEAIIILPRNCFYTTDISVTCWILNNNKKDRVEHRDNGDIKYRDRTGEILFMDLRQMGHPYEKKYIELTQEDRDIITSKFNAWRQESNEEYVDVPEFCHSASKQEIIEKDYSLVPSRYIEFVNKDESTDYDVSMKDIQEKLKELLKDEESSKKELLKVMKDLGYEIKL